MGIAGVQLEFNVPLVSAFKRLYDYKIRKIHPFYSVDDGVSWYPFKEVLTPSGSDSIPFSTTETPVTLITYTDNTNAEIVHPTLYNETQFRLKFVLQVFSNDPRLPQERIHEMTKINNTVYGFDASDPVYLVDEDGFPSSISIIIDDMDVYS